MREPTFSHVPVLLDECIEGLAIRPDGKYLDGTLGGGGHAFEIAKHLESGRLYGLDVDPEALEAAAVRLNDFPNVTLRQGNFREAGAILGIEVDTLDGALLDLGVSSYQLDSAKRGFSYHQDGPLDMRMSGSGLTAAQVIQTVDRVELTDILRRYGEEPYAAAIAAKIISAREQTPIETTIQLKEVITSALPPSVRRKQKNPARQSFQALRIFINDELCALEEGLNRIFDLLKPGGRFCVITFHSLEDRIVKQAFAALARGCECPPDFPVCVCGKTPRASLVVRRPVIPASAECETNRRARSAKLRIIEKIH